MAGAVELEPVIAALNLVVYHATEMQRDEPMRTTIRQCDDGPR